MNIWNWQTWQNLPYLTCGLLDGFPHGFFTRHFEPRSPFDLTAALSPAAVAYRTKQVHGNLVLAPSELREPSEAQPYSEADGLVTEQANQAVWACSADCTPVLIADLATGATAAVHAGWRGTATQIVPEAIARLLAQGSRLENLRVALGPAIAGEVYQVSTTVAAEVMASVLPPSENILEIAQTLPQPPILPDEQPGRVRLDVRRVNGLQLEKLGLLAEQVAIAPDCTYQTPEHFFSYRRDKLKKVQWSGIVSR
jgi:polyphenol oxidase